MIRLFLVLTTLFVAGCGKKEMIKSLSLNGEWLFRQSDLTEDWSKATVPGTIHTDLFKAGLIEDPYYGCNEAKLQWIGEQEWVYRKEFALKEDVSNQRQISLVFEGLDTYASVYLNCEKIGEGYDMFRKWKFDCSGKLRKGKNTIEVHFKSALKQYIADSTAAKIIIPGGQWVYSRKAAYHFGWDWGARYITCGITGPVYFEYYDNLYPQNLHLFTKDISKESATIVSQIEIEAHSRQSAVIKFKEKSSNKVYLTEKIDLTPGIKLYETEFKIENPTLWWCNGLGKPHIYDLICELTTDSGEVWRKDVALGIRKIEVLNREDSIGRPLTIILNDTPVYIKGANYIPQSSFITEPTGEDYERVLETAVSSNMNMLRVWGGGIYERELFYELCSKKGLLVWQDFMFACAMYPWDDKFLDNVREEAIYQVKRLRNYPAIALWCGNNEGDEAWHNWGWQRGYGYSAEETSKIWNGYLTLFHELLPNTVKKYDPGRFYLPSTPMFGWGREKSMAHSSAHYWGVWWGVEPFERYLEKIPRFMSEFGVQAMPQLSTIRDFQPVSADTLFSPQLRSHQKHATGYENIAAYLKYDSLKAYDLLSYIYLSQIIQAKGVGMAIEAQRSSMPYCMGSLYWQLNDCWPVTSWSGMDVNYNWKALQYTVKNLYKDIIISILPKGNRVAIHLISDRTTPLKGRLTLSLISFNGEKSVLLDKELTALPNSSTEIQSFDLEWLNAVSNLENSIFTAQFVTSSCEKYENTKFLLPYGMLKTTHTKVEKRLFLHKGEYHLELTSDSFVPFFYIYTKKEHLHFSDNFFHLFPGEQRSITFKSNLSKSLLEKELEFYSLNDYFKKSNKY